MTVNKFTLGVFAGMSSLMLAVPLLAQVTDAHGAMNMKTLKLPTPTQECVQAMANMESTRLANFDEIITDQKAMLQKRIDGLTAAAQLSADADREEALKQMSEDMHPDEDAESAEIKAARESVMAACGGVGPFMMMGGHPPRGGFFMKADGPMGGKLAEKLGLTEDELKAELDGGKTIEEIATEHGVTLPPRPEHPGKGDRMFRMWDKGDMESSSVESTE